MTIFIGVIDVLMFFSLSSSNRLVRARFPWPGLLRLDVIRMGAATVPFSCGGRKNKTRLGNATTTNRYNRQSIANMTHEQPTTDNS